MSTGSTFEQKEIGKILVNIFQPKEEKDPLALKQKKKKAIILAGPTAAGKTETSLFLCHMLRGEVLSVDSVQVYRGMDIGTAKATTQQRKLVPHHLLDIRDIHEPFNMVDFYHEARHCCDKLITHDTVPIFVGGSGFYLHALLYGPPKGPPSMPKVRQALEEEASRLGIESLYKRLQQQDPKYAATLTSKDRQKIIRALEIITLTHLPVSNLSWRERAPSPLYNFRCWFLHRSRKNLYERAENRCDQMLKDGFLDEVVKTLPIEFAGELNRLIELEMEDSIG